MRSIINISLSKDLVKDLNIAVKKGKYSSKSEFLRELIRQRIYEEDLLDRIEKSRREIKSGKGKILSSLRDLR